MELLINTIPKHYFFPEVSVRRLYRLLSFLKETPEYSSICDNIIPIIGSDLLEKILKDTNLWISAELEEKLINAIHSQRNLSQVMLSIGKEVFFVIGHELLPADKSVVFFEDMLLRLPIIFGRYNKVVAIAVDFILETSAQFHLESLSGKQEKWYDLYFIKGLVDGCLELFQVNGISSGFTNCSLTETNELKKICSSFAPKLNSTLLLIEWNTANKKVAKNNSDLGSINQEAKSKSFLITSVEKGAKEEYTYIDIDSIVNKSKQLYLENRDLEAAVEVLNLLKNELMQKQKSIIKDLKIARNIQKGLIPQKIPDWKGVQFGIYFNPLQEVSGDYYDYFNLSLNKLGILVSDVSGHGVPAAFVTAITKLLFSNNKNFSPSETFGTINYEMLDLIKRQGYLTCFYGIIDSNHELTYALAGHPNPILFQYKTKEIKILEGEGTYLGIFEEAREYFKDFKIILEPGDKIIIYTDGFLEGQSDEGKSFDLNMLIHTILETSDMDVQSTCDYIRDKYENFCMGTDQSDDITLLVFGMSLQMDKLEQYIQKAEIFFHEKKFHEASNTLKEAYNLFPNDMAILLLLGEYNTKSKNYKEAINYLQEYNKIKRNNYYAYYLLGYCYYRLGNFMGAEIELYHSISLKTDNIEPILTLAKVYIKDKKYEKAKYMLERILDIHHENKNARYLLTFIRRII